jgi:hypothetical protein
LTQNSLLKGINLYIFSHYFQLPGLILTQTFLNMAKRGNFILKSEFIQGMLNLYSPDYEIVTKLIFDIYDFDRDGQVSKEDIRVLLSYVTYKNSDDENYENQIYIQKEIEKIIDEIFISDSLLTYQNFMFFIENVSSQIFLIVNIFFYF